MIHVTNPIAEPGRFDTDCRKAGNTWLALHPGAKSSDYPGYWTAFQEDLANGFQDRCGWWAMWIADGEVDHYWSKKNHPALAYQWSNYRYIAGTVNGSKGNHDDKVLDPFQVSGDWFEVIIPSMQLITTCELPDQFKVQAIFTLKQLHLCDGRKVVRSRKHWYESYRKYGSMDQLKLHAPLVAKAVQKWEASGKPLPSVAT